MTIEQMQAIEELIELCKRGCSYEHLGKSSINAEQAIRQLIEERSQTMEQLKIIEDNYQFVQSLITEACKTFFKDASDGNTAIKMYELLDKALVRAALGQDNL